jgi:hypothetical protein
MKFMMNAKAGMVSPKTQNETQPDEFKNERLFSRIALVSAALGFGAEFATVQSLGMNPANISFHFSSQTLVAFLVGAVVGASIWTIISHGQSAHPSSGQRALGVLLILASVAGFLYPLRFLSHERLIETLEGLTVAATVLSSAAFLLWKIRGFLESDATDVEHAAK